MRVGFIMLRKGEQKRDRPVNLLWQVWPSFVNFPTSTPEDRKTALGMILDREGERKDADG